MKVLHAFELLPQDVDKEYERLIHVGIQVAKPSIALPHGFRYFSLTGIPAASS